MPEMPEGDIRRLAQYEALGFDGPAAVTRKIKELETDAFNQREEIRTKWQPLEERIPKKGEQVVAADRLKALEAFEATGLKPEDLTGAVVLRGPEAEKWTAVKDVDVTALQAAAEKVPALEADIATRDKRDARKTAAGLAGFNADVLDGIKGADALTYEVKEEPDPKDSKKKNRTAYVTPEGGEAVKLEEYAAANWSRFLPSLKADGTTTRTTGAEYRREPLEGGRGTAGAAADPTIVGRKMAEAQKAHATEPGAALR